jgi:DNA-directed RNA polymerase specialized sigma24 family protein
VGRNGTAPRPAQQAPHELVAWLLRNGRREKLCNEVARLSGAPYGLVEDALQDVCLLAATTRKCRGRSEGEVYNWLKRTTLRRARRLLERAHLRYEVLVDWSAVNGEVEPAGEGADVELIERERQREQVELAHTVLASLNERQRRVAALHSHGLNGGEIARQLRTSRLRVKHLKAESMARARAALVAQGGGGCEDGERLISRVAFGLASGREQSQAQLHMVGCERCAAVYHRLELLHEKVAALLPLPAAAQVEPGLLERGLHKSIDAIASVKQHATHAGGQAKQQLADAAGQAKQHAAAGYSRAVEYTPLASARPGAAATAIAGCLALGGGAAGYCIDKGVDPISGLVEVVQRSPAKPAQAPPEQKPPAEQPPDPPQLATPAPTPAPEPEPPPAAPAPEQPAAAPAPAPAQPAPPPTPPPEPTPPAVQFGEPATPAQTGPPPPTPSPQPAQPAPAPASGGVDLYGP